MAIFQKKKLLGRKSRIAGQGQGDLLRHFSCGPSNTSHVPTSNKYISHIPEKNCVLYEISAYVFLVNVI